MISSFVAAVVLAASTATTGLPVAGLNTPFPDQGDPITTQAYREDLIAAEYQNGRLPAESLVEIESNPGCFMEVEAAQAWLGLEALALHDGVEFTASWCYRNMKTQRSTYRRNCPWVAIDPPTQDTDRDAGEGEPPADDSDDDSASGDSDTEDPATEDPVVEDPVVEPVVEQPVEVVTRVRVCRVPTARPGNSNHGWGRAVDLTADGALLTCESDAFLWLVENAGRFGWVHPEWAECGADKEEAWHWEWGGTTNSRPGFSRLGQFIA